MFNKHRSTVIHEFLDIESLLLRIKRPKLGWFGHVSRMPQKRLPKQTLYADMSGKRPVGRPRTRWLDYIEDLGRNRLGLCPSEIQSVSVDRDMSRIQKIWSCWPCNPLGKAGEEKRRNKIK